MRIELGAGVAGAIRRKGGPSIQEACRAIGPIPLGEAVVTGAGRLPARHVIHAASMGPSVLTTEASLRASVRNSLLRCVEHGIRTGVLPGHWHRGGRLSHGPLRGDRGGGRGVPGTALLTRRLPGARLTGPAGGRYTLFF